MTRSLPALAAIMIYGSISLIPDSGRWLQSGALFVTLGISKVGLKRPNSQLATVVLGICILAALPVLGSRWPLPSLLATIVSAIWLWPQTKEMLTPIKLSNGVNDIVIPLAISVISSITVLLWYQWRQPLPSEVMFRIPRLEPILLWPLIIAFSAVNAFAEEYIFRGLAFDALTESGLSPIGSNLVQSIAFGVLHFKGFPFGISGSILAAFFAILMGWLRVRSRRLLLPWTAHFLTDVAIAFLLWKTFE